MAEQINLAEYPDDYRGRRSYVYVPSEGKVLAACYTYPSGGVRHLLPEYGGPAYEDKSTGNRMYVMRDIGEYTSTVDGTRITTRSAHRDHIRQHDLVEVGNQRIGSMGRAGGEMSRSGSDIKRALERARAGN